MKQEEAAGTVTETRRRKTRVYSAKEKIQAVLSLWSGRRNASALMKELQVPWGILNGWEKRALTGILMALDPKWKQKEEGPLSLPGRLERLMEQTVNPEPPVVAPVDPQN